MGAEGLDWASYGLERTRDDIESQPWAIEKDFTVDAKKANLLDVWTPEGNIIYVNDDIVWEQEHDFGFTPVAVQVVSLGYGGVLLDDQSVRYEGESIFFLIRELVPELNRIISISQTLNLKAVKPPIKQKLEGTKEQADYEDVMASGASTQLKPTEDITLMDYGDIRATFDRAFNIIETAVREGSLTNIDVGNPSQPFSNVALLTIGEKRGQLLLPRLAAKSLLNESIAEMFTRQVVQIGGSAEIGPTGHKRTFQTSKLDAEYSTEYRYLIKSPQDDVARASVAAGLGNLASRKYKQETIMQFEDPVGMEREINVDEAERLFPSIKADRVIKALVEEGMDFEAELASAAMGVELQGVLRGEVRKKDKPDLPTQVQPTREPTADTQESIQEEA